MKTTRKHRLLMPGIALIMMLTMLFSAAAPAVATDVPEEFATLTWYLPPPTGDMSNGPSILAYVNELIKEKINAHVEFEFIDWGSYQDTMNTMSAAQEPWDLAMSTSWIFNITSNVNKGAILGLNDLLEQYGPDIMARVPSEYWDAVTYRGEKYAVIDVTTYAALRGASVQKELAEKYGLTLDAQGSYELRDFEPFLEQIKANEPEIIPLMACAQLFPMFVDKTSDQLTKWLIYDMSDGKIKTAIESPYRLEHHYGTLFDFYQKGYIAKDAALKTDYLAEGQSQRYAVFCDGGVVTADGLKSSTAYGFPCVDVAQTGTVVGTGSIQAAATAIGKNSKNPERAMMLINLLYADKYIFNTLCFGLEGQDYEVVSDAGTDNPTVRMNDDMKWAIWHPWIGNLFDQWPCVNGNTAEALQQMLDGNSNGTISPILGFVFDTEPIKMEISQIDAIWADAEPILNTGSAPDLDQYIAETLAKMKDAGLDKVIAETERQLAEWQASR